MAYGLSIKNDFNEVMIDDTYPLYVRVSSGTISVTGGSAGTTLSFPASYTEPPLVFINNTTYAVAVIGYVKSGSLYTGIVFTCPISVTTTVKYKVYVTTRSLGQSSATHGLRVFNGAGQIVMDSQYTPLKIEQVISGSFSPSGSGPYTINLPTSMPTAGYYYLAGAVVGMGSAMIRPSPPLFNILIRGLYIVSNSEIAATMVPIGQDTQGASSAASTVMSIPIIV